VLALLATAGAGYMSWQWWQQGAQIEALRTDLAAAYAEVESLRARPEIVSPPAPAAEAPIDGAAVLPIEAGAAPESPPALAADAAIPVDPPPATPSAATPSGATQAPAPTASAPAIIQAQ
jgi:hypothetical protein